MTFFNRLFVRALLQLQDRSTATFVSIFLLFVMGCLPAYAQVTTVSTVSATTMLQNIAAQLPNLMRMVTAIAYVMGMYFIIAGIFKLKHFGEQRSLMSQEHGLLGPIILIAVGTLLLYLPTSVQVGLSSFWTNPNPYGYLQQENQWSDFLNICFMIIQFIGTISFIRGLVLLSHLGGQGGQQGNLGKGLTHIIAGIFCINIYQFVQVVLATLGLQPLD